MKHYYTNNEDLDSKESTFTFNFDKYSFLFTVDNGVFSKSMVDYGSRVLLNNVVIDESKKTLLDVGCGYGTFGICLKKVYNFLDVDMVDVNERALHLAKINNDNNCQPINIYQSSVYDNVEKSFDMIVSNPPIRAGKKIVKAILEGAYDHLNDNGELWVVIQKKQGAPSAKKTMNETFGNCEIIKRDKGYYVLKSIKISTL